ncbi:hypothetical protein ACFQ0X_11145 [Streptomyces rectiviolaceus]
MNANWKGARVASSERGLYVRKLASLLGVTARRPGAAFRTMPTRTPVTH